MVQALHIFAKVLKLVVIVQWGTQISESMNATFLDNQGKAQPLIMGCYGIGISNAKCDC